MRSALRVSSVAVGDDGLVDGALGEAGGRCEVGGVAAEEAELGVGVVAAVANPAVEEEVATAEEVGVGAGLAAQEGADLGLEFGGELLVGVEGEDPGSGAAFDGEVFLAGEAEPGLADDLGVEGSGDLDGAIG